MPTAVDPVVQSAWLALWRGFKRERHPPYRIVDIRPAGISCLQFILDHPEMIALLRNTLITSARERLPPELSLLRSTLVAALGQMILPVIGNGSWLDAVADMEMDQLLEQAALEDLYAELAERLGVSYEQLLRLSLRNS